MALLAYLCVLRYAALQNMRLIGRGGPISFLRTYLRLVQPVADQRMRPTGDPKMNLDHLVAQVIPVAALAIAAVGTFAVFAAYFH